ncbi:molybdopterin-synthase adenylyltransferase MoeB [Silanimonas sp.]|uniref:molybdopterin-synthase adenylyltransferase MoeB n=1 Tax=Silanimonas sp. TaxID=1929290 RepID=UPI0025F043E1|nr:molybdopterin-synthase adenylyltransferase MoeB [Silanimonas sp.]
MGPGRVPEISVEEAARRVAAGARLVDVREPAEVALGAPAGALHLPLSVLQDDPSLLPDDGRPLLLLCAIGQRSRRAAAIVLAAGHGEVANVAGGFVAWRAAGLPLAAEPLWPGATADAAERYDRHLRLAGVGQEGQRRLAGSGVLLLGAGGLGSPAALYLAAAGVGHLRIVDDDVIERSNLQRQILHTEAGIGRPKVESARERLLALNPSVRVEAIRERLSAANVEALLHGVDVVLDGSDNFATRYLLNAACVRLGLPLVHAAVERFQGQVSVFVRAAPGGAKAPCYRCLHPEPPGPEAAPNCAEAGVLGVLPGLLGLVQATETLKLLLGLGEPLAGRLLLFDALGLRFREVALAADPDCATCGPQARFTGYHDLEAICAAI